MEFEFLLFDFGFTVVLYFFFSSRRGHMIFGYAWTLVMFFFFSSRRRHTRFKCDWSSDVCSSDLERSPGKLPRRQGSDDAIRRRIEALNVRNVRGNFSREKLADFLVAVRRIDQCGILSCLSQTQAWNGKKPHRAESNHSNNRHSLGAQGRLLFKRLQQRLPNSLLGSPAAKKHACPASSTQMM